MPGEQPVWTPPPMPVEGGGSPAEGSDHDVPPQHWPGRNDFPPPANRASGNVYPSTGAPAQPAPEHQQPPAIPPPDEEPALDEASESAPAADSYGKWARNERASAGTVYGGKGGASASTGPAVGGGSPLENSGSLTGHILSQGTAESDDLDDDEAPARSGNRRVIIIIAAILVVLIVGGYFAVTLAQNFIDGIFGGLTPPKK
jgi:hypothetical protein